MDEEKKTITYQRKKHNKKEPKVIETLEPIKEEEETLPISKDKAKALLPKKEQTEKQKAHIERLVALNKEKKLKRLEEAKAKEDEIIKLKAEAEQKEKDDLAKQGLRKVKYVVQPRKKHVNPRGKEKKKEEKKEEEISQEKQKGYLKKDEYDYPSDTDEDESDDSIPSASETSDTKQIKRKVQKIKQLQSAITETKSNPYNDLLKKYF